MAAQPRVRIRDHYTPSIPGRVALSSRMNTIVECDTSMLTTRIETLETSKSSILCSLPKRRFFLDRRLDGSLTEDARGEPAQRRERIHGLAAVLGARRDAQPVPYRLRCSCSACAVRLRRAFAAAHRTSRTQHGTEESSVVPHFTYKKVNPVVNALWQWAPPRPLAGPHPHSHDNTLGGPRVRCAT